MVKLGFRGYRLYVSSLTNMLDRQLGRGLFVVVLVKCQAKHLQMLLCYETNSQASTEGPTSEFAEMHRVAVTNTEFSTLRGSHHLCTQTCSVCLLSLFAPHQRHEYERRSQLRLYSGLSIRAVSLGFHLSPAAACVQGCRAPRPQVGEPAVGDAK